jgi:hypothetical protein
MTTAITTIDLPLTRLETFWARLVLPSFTGTSHGFVAPDTEVDYLEGLRRFMSKASDKANLGIRVAFFLAVTTPFWLGGRLKGFASLTPVERSELLDRMSHHRVFFVRELCLLLKLIACMAIFRVPGTRERTGYDGLERERRAAGVRKLPVLRTPTESGDFPTAPSESESPAIRAVGGAR